MRNNFAKWLTKEFALPLLLSCCGAAAGEPTDNPPDTSRPTGKIVNKSVKVKTNLKCRGGTGLDYGNFGKGFLQNYCTSCHSAELPSSYRIGAPMEINFDSAEDAQNWRARILKVVKPATVPDPSTPVDSAEDVTNTSTTASSVVMPPDGNIMQEDRDLFLEWLNCGAPAADP